MASKKSNTNKTLGLLAFIALFVSGITKLLNAFNISNSILNLVVDVCLVIVVVWTAYYFAKSLSKTWKIIYWILAILSLASLILYGYNAIG